MRLKKAGIILLTCAVLTVGCGVQNAAGFISESYNLENVEGQGQAMQKVYRAAGKSVPQVASEIADQTQPREMSSKSEERMFLVYPNQVVHVQQDPEQKSDTLVEVNTPEFVRDNYDPNFLSTFLTVAFISSMFGGNWRSYPARGYYGYGDYKYRNRYGTPGGYVPPRAGYQPPTRTTPAPGYKQPPRTGRGKGRVIRKRR